MDIIFDIDGTLADCSHRLHWIQSKPKNWNAFFAGMAAPEEDLVVVVNHLIHPLYFVQDVEVG